MVANNDIELGMEKLIANARGMARLIADIQAKALPVVSIGPSGIGGYCQNETYKSDISLIAADAKKTESLLKKFMENRGAG